MNCKKWTEKSRTLMMMTLHSFMFLGKNGGRGLTGCENSVKSEENGLGWYMKNNIEPLLVAVRTSRTITHKEKVDPKELKRTEEEQSKNE